MESFFDIDKLKSSKYLSLNEQYYKFTFITTDVVAIIIAYE